LVFIEIILLTLI